MISPDLTTNDKTRQEPSGGPITKDNTGVEIYCTIFAATESHLEKGVLWCGSDDGLIHISELANQYVQNPSDVVSVGDIVRVKVLDVDLQRRRIAVSRKQA